MLTMPLCPYLDHHLVVAQCADWQWEELMIDDVVLRYDSAIENNQNFYYIICF